MSPIVSWKSYIAFLTRRGIAMPREDETRYNVAYTIDVEVATALRCIERARRDALRFLRKKDPFRESVEKDLLAAKDALDRARLTANLGMKP